MALDDRMILLAGLVEIVLPDRTVRLCDGGFVDWPARGVFRSKDSEFGTVETVESIAEAVGDEAPSGRMTLLPPSVAEAADLFRSDAQGSPIRFWLAEVNQTNGELVGTPEIMFDGLVDTVSVRFGKNGRQVDIEFMAEAERLFMIREGNVLSTRFHQTAWPGEKGFDHCTGSQVAVPWGVADPGRGTIFSHLVEMFMANRPGRT